MSRPAHRSRHFAFGPLVLALLVTACSSESGESTDPRQELLQSWWDGFFALELEALETRTAELQSRAESYCADPASTSLDDVRSAWADAHRSLKRHEVFNFGPYSEEPLRFRPRLDFWPARPDSIDQTVTARESWTPADFATLGSAARGLPAVEYLLWNETPLEATRCEYLAALSGDVALQAAALREAWDPARGGYWKQLLQPGGDSDFESTLLAVSAVVNRLWFTVENVRRMKLGKPLGEDSGGTPEPELAEARFMPRSLDAIRDNLDAIERLYFGDDDLVGLQTFVGQRRPELNDEVRQHLADSRAALDAIDAPLVDAIVSERDDVQAAIDALGGLQTAIEVDVISVLGLSLSFNDNDGD